MSTPEQQTPGASPAASNPPKPQRVLACVLCQQRKVKCDRTFPCTNCIKSRVPCVPATLTPRQRRRRFPERVLLERLRKYEDLLRQHNVEFEPLHKDPAIDKSLADADGNDHSDDDRPDAVAADSSSPAPTAASDRIYGVKDFWRAMSKGLQDGGDDSDSSIGDVHQFSFNSWDQLFANSDHLLLGARKTTVPLYTLHPEPVQIFRLWQTYLDNVNPLFKATHTQTLQSRIIDAASNLKNASPSLEALMFSIYCMAITSLTAEDCQARFGAPKDDLLTRYQFGCQEALCNAGYLRTAELDCLTALFLYLVSVGPITDPRSLSSMIGVTVRIARRIGIHSEIYNSKCSSLEAEIRRRLWWAIVFLDARLCELSNAKHTELSPFFDCKTPLNVHDSDLRAETKELPPIQLKPTEAIFAVVRGEMAAFVRNTAFYLDFAAPFLSPFARDGKQTPVPVHGEMVTLEKTLEEKYLQFCDLENPLHFLTIWSTRYYISKYRLMEMYWLNAGSTGPQTETYRDEILTVALRMVESDTMIMQSPLTRGFSWVFQIYFPFPAYIHTMQDLRRRPFSTLAERAWDVLDHNYQARVSIMHTKDSPVFKMFSKFLFDAWQARDTASAQKGEQLATPKIVTRIQARLAELAQNALSEQSPNLNEMGLDSFSMSMPLGFGNSDMLYGMGGQHDGFAVTAPGGFSNLLTPASSDADMNELNWAAMGWGMNGRRGWWGP